MIADFGIGRLPERRVWDEYVREVCLLLLKECVAGLLDVAYVVSSSTGEWRTSTLKAETSNSWNIDQNICASIPLATQRKLHKVTNDTKGWEQLIAQVSRSVCVSLNLLAEVMSIEMRRCS